MSQKNIVLIALVAMLFAIVAAGCTSSAPVVKTGDNATIDYVMRLPNGTLVDTSIKQVAIDGGHVQCQLGIISLIALLSAPMR